MKTRKVVWEAAEDACKKQKHWDQFKAYWNQWKHFNGPWTRPSLVKWNGEINGLGRETNLELVEVDGTAVKKKWSGRKERAWAVENQDRGWQPAALEFGKWLRNAMWDLFACFCSMWQQTRIRNTVPFSLGTSLSSAHCRQSIFWLSEYFSLNITHSKQVCK